MVLDLLGLILTFTVFAVPGIVLSFALFTGTRFNKLDRVLAGLILGATVLPLLAFLEYLLLGIKLSALLVLGNALLVIVIGVALLYKRGLVNIVKPSYLTEVMQREAARIDSNPFSFLVPLALVIILLFGFYLRIAFSFITNYFEFDPYYYTFLTEMLVKNGAIPLSSDISYFPLTKFHHEPAMMQYLTGSWYLLYNFFTGSGFNKEALILVTNIYPPLMGAFLSILAFWFLRTQYNELAGIAGALFFASMPTLLQKFVAGVAELQPWGIFSALFIFTAFCLALRYKEKQFTALAVLAVLVAVLGAVQSLWPIGVMAVFFVIQSFVNYYAGHDELKLAIIAVAFSASVLIGTMLYNLYTDAGVFTFPIGVFVAIFSCVPALVFYALSRSSRLASKSRRSIVLAILVVGAIASLLPVLPSGQSISSVASSFIDVTAAFAHYAGPLSRTIAEETPTNPAVLASVFGVIGPVVLLALAVMLAIGGIEALLLKREHKLAGAFLLGSIAIVLFRSEIARFSIAFGQSTGLNILATLGKLLAANELFAFLIVSLAAAIIAFIYTDEASRNETSLLTVLVVYPVAYIGLNKVKFLVHLGVALAVGGGVLIGEIVQRAKFIHEYFSVGEKVDVPLKWTTGFAVVLLLILGSIQVFGFSDKSPGAFNTVVAVSGGRISQDWLDAMSWLRNNTNFHDASIQANCKQRFGHDCRVISWWDYGHWTAFLGETKTVLDPGNSFEFLDQGVAYGFVDNETAFRKSMEYHNASHVLVDFQLIEKWGALVFLSGTCKKTADDSNVVRVATCPDKRAIENWQGGAGQSTYELDHYFENLNVQGECPFAPNMVLVGSNLGTAYCLSQTEMVPLDRSGLRTDLARSFQAINLRERVENVSVDMNYLIPTSQQSFVNVNPDLRVAGRVSSLINSTFVRLYVFENLPGFKLAYRSPNGEVKIFERTFSTR